MARESTFFIGLLGAFMIIESCITSSTASSSKITSLRTIILNETDTIIETDFGGLTTWKCKDFIDGGRTLVEVGIFNAQYMEGIGFILFDGGNKGEETRYKRSGLNHRWDWDLAKSDNSYNYSFVIKPDGTGLFYDFSSAKSGETIKANDVFVCRQ